MSKDLDLAATSDTEPNAGKPFVRVYRDQDGRVIIALDVEAMDGLATILDAADLKEMYDNPSYVGLDVVDAHLAAGVGYDILGQLRNLAPYSY